MRIDDWPLTVRIDRQTQMSAFFAGVDVWALGMRDKRGHRLAAVALSRKLAAPLHRMWVTGLNFDPNYGAA